MALQVEPKVTQEDLASNGYGEHSPQGYSYMAALIAEVILTFMFLFVILGATDKRAPKDLPELQLV